MVLVLKIIGDNIGVILGIHEYFSIVEASNLSGK